MDVGGYTIVTVRGAEHFNKPMMGKPTSVCWIARGRHQVSFQLELPSYGDQSRFKAGADVIWEVRDLYLAAEERVVDVERMLRPPLEARLRGVSRRYSLDSAQQVDEAIQDELASGRWNGFGADLGLVTQVFIRIDLGQAAADHQAPDGRGGKGQHGAGSQGHRPQAEDCRQPRRRAEADQRG
jgi:hypothetical protein